MRTNADCTLYIPGVNPITRTSEWTRVQVRCVTWQASDGAKILPNGVIRDDKATIFIPFARGPLALAEGCLIVKGLVNDELTPAFTESALRAKYHPNALKIQRVTPRDYGSASMQHWEVSAS